MTENRLTWLGDSLIDGALPAFVTLRHESGTVRTLSLHDVLAVASNIETHGLKRIVTALEHGFARGELADDDATLWARERARVIALMESRGVEGNSRGEGIQDGKTHERCH
jgi:hypothetical protein